MVENKRVFLIFIIAVSLFIDINSSVSKNNIVIAIGSKDKQVSETESNIIVDLEFKSQLSEFLRLDSTLDYDNIYNYLSKRYLSKHFPDINSAQEYGIHMEEISDRTKCEYIEILNIQKISEEKYQVDLISKTNLEGQDTLVKERYFFVKEGVEWKYDGLDSDFMEWIPLEEE